MSSLPAQVTVREVGPRDGLQAEAPLPVAKRVELIEAVLAAGVTHLEATAFVSPRAVLAMSQPGSVLRHVGRREGVTMAALVPNLRGARDAADTGLVDELTATISISETYNQRNVRMSVADSVKTIGEICALGLPVDAVVSCAFGSPYEGEIAASDVGALVDELRAGGAASVTCADTTGMATPRRVREVLEVTGVDIGLHFHETRGTALVNAHAALEAGVTRFDTSVGGLGGSPFAHGAAGNLATEGLVALLDDLGVATGIDVEAMCAAASVAAGLVGHDVPSPVAHAGPRTRLVRGVGG